jgi:DNA-binding transcriptional ArsR family regulator
MQPDTVFAAIGDPTRRAIVEHLSESDATILELSEPFGMTLQAVGKHIRILEHAGVVRRKKIGRSNHCTLNRKALFNARQWLEQIENDWNARLDRLTEFLDDAD